MPSTQIPIICSIIRIRSTLTSRKWSRCFNLIKVGTYYSLGQTHTLMLDHSWQTHEVIQGTVIMYHSVAVAGSLFPYQETWVRAVLYSNGLCHSPIGYWIKRREFRGRLVLLFSYCTNLFFRFACFECVVSSNESKIVSFTKLFPYSVSSLCIPLCIQCT